MSLNDINSAIFSIVTTDKDLIAKDDTIRIVRKGESNPDLQDNIAFSGYVKNINNNKDGSFTYECKEMGNCLREMNVVKTTGGLFKSRVIIHNPEAEHGQLTIDEFVKIILSFYKSHPRLTYNPGVGK